jgi:adenylosuccinate lyase
MNVLAGIGASAYKFSNDLRLLQHLREIEEPFESEQIGSSAMAYKRNPMRSERIASLSRFLITDSFNSYLNSSSQWFERTLDDSADRRITIPEGFMAADGILNLCINVSLGLTVNEKIIQKHLDEQMPFMVTENILMETVKKGGDRQKLHEKIRVFSLETAERVKRGDSNDLLERIAADPDFAVYIEELMDVVSADKYIGRADKQTEEYLKTVVEKIRKDNKELLGMKAQVSV